MPRPRLADLGTNEKNMEFVRRILAGETLWDDDDPRFEEVPAVKYKENPHQPCVYCGQQTRWSPCPFCGGNPDQPGVT